MRREESKRIYVAVTGYSVMYIVEPYVLSVLYMLTQRDMQKTALYASKEQLLVLNKLIEKGYVEKDGAHCRITSSGGELYRRLIGLAEIFEEHRYIDIANHLRTHSTLNRVERYRENHD